MKLALSIVAVGAVLAITEACPADFNECAQQGGSGSSFISFLCHLRSRDLDLLLTPALDVYRLSMHCWACCLQQQRDLHRVASVHLQREPAPYWAQMSA